MNIYEFLTFPDISNNINAVLFYPLKSYRHPALRESALTYAVYGISAILDCKDSKYLWDL